MKLFHKIFLCFIVIFGAAFQMAGYLLINFAYGNAMGQEKSSPFRNFNITDIFCSLSFTPSRISFLKKK